MVNNQMTALKPQQTITTAQLINIQIDNIGDFLREHPDGPFAIALSVTIVIGAIAGLIKTLKSK
ncbi:hypothetical protein [Nodularia spumigena]|jgi:hypothetical protein|uniref:Uncharacterized protein n=2 Tax=Nodularia spumigena TaxID=70799 RepID=A0ABU5UW73_NODSP|nr:hypothetical protein [Nodularia spumigena]MEA5523967.1 hypothetical protein [Nodularia spumigena UHCC 0143]MEA5610044.1 hypothetical protein [Nodularia spumigena UHCC 0060]